MTTTMLEGAELLAKIKELGKDISKTEAVRACGYVSTKKDGSERVNYTAFYAALAAAKGVSFSDSKAPDAPAQRGRGLSYTTTVHANGTICIGGCYSRELGLMPGDVLQIKSGRGRGRLQLQLVGDADEAPADACPAACPAPSIVPDVAPKFGVPVAA